MTRMEISGTVLDEPSFSHKSGETFYTFLLASKRLSGNQDIVPCIASEVFKERIKQGEKITLLGEVRTFDVHENEKSRLKVFVFVKTVASFEKEINEVEIVGYLSKEPLYRELLSGRKISDLMLASNREYGKSDYIPCICWGRNAIRIKDIDIGTEMKIIGRLQSREYAKHFDDETEEIRTAYEVSISKMDIVEKEK